MSFVRVLRCGNCASRVHPKAAKRSHRVALQINPANEEVLIGPRLTILFRGRLATVAVFLILGKIIPK